MVLKIWLFAIAGSVAISVASAQAPATAVEIERAAEDALKTLDRKTHRTWEDREAEAIRSSANSILAAKLSSAQQITDQQIADGEKLYSFVTDMSLVCSNQKPLGSNFSKRICQTRRLAEAQAEASKSRLRDMQSTKVQ